MAGALGDLVISLRLNLAEFTAPMDRATYETRRMAESMKTEMSSISHGFESISESVRTVGELLGIGLSIEGLRELVKSTMEASNKLYELSEYTGSSVEALSKLEPAARASGVGIDGVAQMTAKLSKSLSEAQDPASKAAAAFESFGISGEDVARMLREDAATALIEVARKMSEYEGGISKAAAQSEILGRGSAALAAFLVEVARRHSEAATTSTEQAEAAHALHTSLVDLETATNNLAENMLGPLINALTGIAQAFTGATGQGEALRLAFAGLGQLLNGLAFAVALAVNVFESLGEQIGHLAYSLTLLPGLLTGSAEAQKRWSESTVEHKARLDAIDAALQDFAGKLRTGTTETDTHTRAVEGGKKAHDGFAGAVKATVSEAEKFIATLRQSTQTIGMDSYELDLHKASQLGVLQQTIQLIDKKNEETIRLAANKAAIGEASQAYAQQEKALGDAINAQSKHVVALNESIAALQRERDTIGMSDTQRRIYIAGLELQIARDKDAEASTFDTRTEVEQLGQKLGLLYDIAARTELVDAAAAAAEAWKQTAKSIERGLEDAFMNVVKGTKSAFEGLKQMLEELFRTLVLRPLLQPVAGAIAGAFGTGLTSTQAMAGGLQAAGGAGNAASGLGGIGNMVSGGMDWLSAGGVFSSGLGGAFATSGIGEALGLSTLAEFSTGAMALTGAGLALGAAIPLIGIGLAIASAMGAFDSKGGPKSGGYGFTGGAGSGLDWDRATHFTPNSADADMAKMATETQTLYNTLVKSLGGTGSANFGFGFDTDPNGTASNRAEARAAVGGQEVYHYFSGDSALGRDNAALEATLKLEAQRALIAALAASDLPQTLARAFNAVDARSLSQDSIDRLLAFGQAYVSVSDIMARNPMDDAAAAVKAATATVYDSFISAGAALNELAGKGDLTTQGLNDLAASTGAYYNSLVALLAQIQQISSAIDSMFADSIRSWQLDAMSAAQKVQFYQNEIADLQTQLLTATDPQAIRGLAERINKDMNSLWGLLSPEDKARMLPDFTQQATAINDLVQQKLTSIGNSVQETANGILETVRGMLDGAADKIARAGESIQAGGSDILAAAQTPNTVDVHVTVDGPATAEVNA